MGSYLRQFFMAAVPAAILFSLCLPWRKKRLKQLRLHSSFLREAGLTAFVMCLCGLLSMVFQPGPRLVRAFPLDGVNLMPFRMIAGYFRDFGTEHTGFAIILFFGNMGTFLPLGFFPPLLFRGWNWGKISLFGAGLSFSIELTQYFLGRHCDIDDIILNVLGVLMGYGLYVLLHKLAPRRTLRFQAEKIS